MMQFENRRVEIVNQEIGRLREATQLMNSVMASLNLPAAIEDLSGILFGIIFYFSLYDWKGL